MKWGDGNADDTEETTRQHDAQRDGRDVDAETSARNDKGGTPTCDACERQAGDDDSREQGDSDSDTSEDEAHKTQRDENDPSGKAVPKWGVKRLREDTGGAQTRTDMGSGSSQNGACSDDHTQPQADGSREEGHRRGRGRQT